MISNFFIETQRLHLRPRTTADLAECLAMDSDPLVTQFIPGPWGDAMRHREFVLQRMGTSDPPPSGYWVVEDKETHQWIGWLFLERSKHHPPSSAYEMGWRFARLHWGRGYAYEAAEALLGYVVHELHPSEIYAEISIHNEPSIRLAKKLGMVWRNQIRFQNSDDALDVLSRQY